MADLLWSLIVCIGVSSPLKNTTPTWQAPPINWQTVQAPLLGNPPFYIDFS